jgi:type 1 glutamine amidotransferase
MIGHFFKNFLLASICIAACYSVLALPSVQPRFRVLALAENGGHHIAYSKAAKVWLDKLAADSGFAIDYIHDTKLIDSAFLSRYQVFIQLDYPPYGWGEQASRAFERYVSEGKGGWIGFHHASLLGEFDGYGVWPWFYDFMGKIRFKDIIADFAAGDVHVEDTAHPVFKGVPRVFNIRTEEWYTYDRSPRPNVHVLANVDEHSYRPASAKTMGDHPVIWTNTACKARNIYIFMGHSPDLFDNEAYLTLFTNAIFWAKGEKPAVFVSE